MTLDLFASYSVGLVPFIALLTLPGLPITLLLFRKILRFTELLPVTASLSIVLNSVVIFYLGLLRMAESANLFSVTVLMVAIGCALGYRYRSFVRKPAKTATNWHMGFATALCLSYVAAIMSLYMIHSISMPFTEWDAVGTFNHWALEFWESRILRPMGDYGVYPQGLAATYAWLYVLSGFPNEHLAHLLTPIFGVMTLVFLWHLGRELGSTSWLAVFLLILLPEFGYNLHSGFSDLPAAALVSGSLFLLLKTQTLVPEMGRIRGAMYLLSGLLMGGAAWFRLSAILPAAGMVLYLIWTLRNSRRLLLRSLAEIGVGIACMTHWLIWIVLVQGVGPFTSQAQVYMSDAFWWGRANPTVLDRVLTSVYTTLNSGNPILLILVVWGSLATLAFGGASRRLVATLFLPTWLVWSFTLSFDTRYLILVLPIAAVSTAKPLGKLLKATLDRATGIRFHSRQIKLVLGVALIVLCLPSAWGSLTQAVKGPGPDQTWSLTHLTATDDEKRLAVLGSMYAAVLYVRSNQQLSSAPIVTMDSRIPSFLANANFSWPRQFEDLKEYRFLIVAAWAFRDNGWNESPLANMIKNGGTTRLVPIASFDWSANFAETYRGYAIFEIR
jgi:hypothetical protein